MTDLSSAAQAVVTAIEKFDWEAGHFSREDIWMNSREVTAAALRAAAYQIAEMYNKKPADIDNIDVLTLSELVRIAAELDE